MSRRTAAVDFALRVSSPGFVVVALLVTAWLWGMRSLSPVNLALTLAPVAIADIALCGGVWLVPGLAWGARPGCLAVGALSALSVALTVAVATVSRTFTPELANFGDTPRYDLVWLHPGAATVAWIGRTVSCSGLRPVQSPEGP